MTSGGRMNRSQERLALQLFDGGAVLDKRRSPGGLGFRTLKHHEMHPDAVPSPFYLSLRLPPAGSLTAETMQSIGDELYRYAFDHKLVFDHVVGIPAAGEPIADAFGRHIEQYRPMRLGKVEEHGERHVRGIVAGIFKKGELALVIDDLVTRAGSKLEGARELSAHGLVVQDILVLIDREQGGADEVRRAGYLLHSVFSITELIGLYESTGRMPREMCEEIRRYLFG